MPKPTLLYARLQRRPLRWTRSAPLAWLLAAAERQRQRRALAALDETRLSDIGLTRSQALAEARKPFWR